MECSAGRRKCTPRVGPTARDTPHPRCPEPLSEAQQNRRALVVSAAQSISQSGTFTPFRACGQAMSRAPTSGLQLSTTHDLHLELLALRVSSCGMMQKTALGTTYPALLTGRADCVGDLLHNIHLRSQEPVNDMKIHGPASKCLLAKSIVHALSMGRRLKTKRKR